MEINQLPHVVDLHRKNQLLKRCIAKFEKLQDSNSIKLDDLKVTLHLLYEGGYGKELNNVILDMLKKELYEVLDIVEGI